MKVKHLVPLLVLGFLGLQGFAQNTLTGNVKNYNSEPVSDAMIYLDTIKADVKVNRRGYFKVDVPETTKEIHVFSPKYGLLSSEYNGEDKLSFVYLDQSKNKDESSSEFVSMDYSELTDVGEGYSESSLNLEDDKDVVGFNNIYDYIRGRVAGVSVSSNGVIRIRGVNTAVGTSQPLFVVNGMQVENISYINVNEIKEIKVIKDGASIYGSRGSNGVLVINLKQ